jgi:multidrug resistance protein, MATE family
MLRAMLASVAVYVVALLILVPLLGNHGLWAALMVLNGVRTFTLWRLYPKVAALADR